MSYRDDFSHIVEAAQVRSTGQLDPFTISYVTDGGTWIVASNPQSNDDGTAHDLIAVIPFDVEGSRVLPLRITANPDLVHALRDALDGTEGDG